MRPRLVLWLCWLANRLMDLAERIQGPRRVVELDGIKECARTEYRRKLTEAEAANVHLQCRLALARGGGVRA